jgi:hypothetical protein
MKLARRVLLTSFRNHPMSWFVTTFRLSVFLGLDAVGGSFSLPLAIATTTETLTLDCHAPSFAVHTELSSDYYALTVDD